MKTHTITTYGIHELSETAKAKAIEKMQQYLHEADFLLDYFEDYVKEQGKEQGFEIENIQYSLSNSQGDGLSFNGTFDITKLLKEFCPTIKTSLADVIYNNTDHRINNTNHRYVYAKKSDVYISFEPSNYNDLSNISDFIVRFESFVCGKHIIFCKEMECEGYKWIEGATSESAAIEHIEANEYEYYETGERF